MDLIDETVAVTGRNPLDRMILMGGVTLLGTVVMKPSFAYLSDGRARPWSLVSKPDDQMYEHATGMPFWMPAVVAAAVFGLLL